MDRRVEGEGRGDEGEEREMGGRGQGGREGIPM
jgi:hypothetical protein